MYAHPPKQEESCNLIVNSVRNSNLNSSLHETPYSLYLTVRKSVSKNKISQADQEQFPVDKKTASETLLQEKIEKLRDKLSEADSINDKLKYDLEEVVNDSEEKYLQIQNLDTKVLTYKEANTKLESNLDEAEKQWKMLNKQVKEKDNQIHDQKKKKKSNILESISDLKTRFSNLNVLCVM